MPRQPYTLDDIQALYNKLFNDPVAAVLMSPQDRQALITQAQHAVASRNACANDEAWAKARSMAKHWLRWP